MQAIWLKIMLSTRITSKFLCNQANWTILGSNKRWESELSNDGQIIEIGSIGVILQRILISILNKARIYKVTSVEISYYTSTSDMKILCHVFVCHVCFERCEILL